MKDPDKGLIEAFKAMSDRLGLVSTIKDLANEIYKKMEDVKSSKGRSKNPVLAACLYIACEKLKNPRRMKEICWAANGLKEKILGHAITEIKKNLDKTMDDGKAIDAGDFLKRFCSLLGMSNKAAEAAQQAYAKTQEVIDIRRAPQSVVASVIYMIAQLSGDRKQIRDVADATGVKPTTINKCCKEIHPFGSRLVPAWYANEDLKKLCQP
ncbi:transcription initiation factor IIB-like [Papaver somniferum]|nr:transcription initiation factor IIB-like [Papaver somniferum]